MDTDKVEKISPDYWRNSHLSIARHFGGCTINGVQYVIDKMDYLVRKDIWKKERLAEGKKKKDRKKFLEEVQLPLTPLKKKGYR